MSYACIIMLNWATLAGRMAVDEQQSIRLTVNNAPLCK